MIYDNKPWLKSYDPEVRAEIDIPDCSVADAVLESCREFASLPACHFLGTTLTFQELADLAGRFASGLRERGLEPGDVVALHLPNIPQYLIAVLGILRAGCVVSGLSPLLVPDEIVYQLNDSRARVLVTLDALVDAKIAPVAERFSTVEAVIVTGLFDFAGAQAAAPSSDRLAGRPMMSFLDFLQCSKRLSEDVVRKAEDLCFLQYTGGTTGPPKGAMLTHRNIVANISQYEHWMQLERGRERILSGFPMFHQAGLFIAVSALAWATAQILVPDPRNLDHIVQEFRQHKPTLMSNVPSLYLMLLGHEPFRQLDFSQVKFCMSGAAPFPVDKIQALESVVGAGKIIEVWGMTETSPLVTVNPRKGTKKPGSVGLPLPSTRLRIVDLKDGRTQVPLGAEGELIASGPQVMKGYWMRPEETRGALREHDGAIWMHTGDVGIMDGDGYVYVVDRAKDMIIVGGYKVFSSEVEDKFYKHPAVGMCALVGLPNPERPDSEIVKLVVQKSAAYRDVPDSEVEAELKAFARETFAPYKVPKIYEFVEAIPLTSVGKVNKKVLRVRRPGSS